MVTREEYCSFTLQGRLRLLGLYGSVFFEKITRKKGTIIFKMDNYYVVVIIDIERGIALEANPVWSKDLLEMYCTL